MSDTNPTSIDQLQPNQKLKGTIKKLELFGAIVDIGIPQPGLIHISQLKKGRVNNVSDVVDAGQEVTVWVRRVDEDSGRVELTMLEPPEVSWSEVKEGQTITGKVVRLEDFGAFVDFGAERPGLVHVSELTEGYVKSPSDVVEVGQEVEARVIGVNRKKSRIDLSMRALVQEPVIEEEDDEEEPVTAFAAAYQRALDGEEGTNDRASAASDDQERKRNEQDDLLQRTLEQHREREE